MNQTVDPKLLIVELLTIIDFQDNKEQFAEKFIVQCFKQSIINAIEHLEEDKKKHFLAEIKDKKTTEDMRSTVQKYIPAAVFQPVLQQTTQKQFESYIEEILPTLTDAKRRELLEYLSYLSRLTVES